MLPIFSVKDEFLQAVSRGAVVVSAPTGSGKSTQIPKFMLDAVPENQRVLVLQPRRLAARMLAERVAFEMGEKPGGVVGYQTRYEHAVSERTRILFITEGILTRMLIAQPSLPGVAAVIFDEFHERSIHTDLGIAMARHTCRNLRPDLKLVVMSATIDTAPISAYLGECPVVKSDGRLFDVDISYITQEEKKAGVALCAARALAKILNQGLAGDVLIFMPGGYEIRKTIEACSALRCSEKLELLPLYGDLPPEAQRRTMEPCDHRKVIVATNIAETSLTIPGVRHVIDSGLARYNTYDPIRGVDSLDTLPIARDSADQRAGRAGREAPGTCQRLWSWIEQSAKYSRTIPEIQRVDLAEAVLAVNAYGFHRPMDFPWYDSPPQRPLEGAQKLLEQLGFVVPEGGGLTELGRRLQSFPAHPRLALLMWLGAQQGCFSQTAWAAAILSERPVVTAGSSPRAVSREHRAATRQKKKEEGIPPSDFLMQTDLVMAARDAHFATDYCQSLGINPGAARDVARAAQDYMALGQRAGWLKEGKGGDLEFLKCILKAFPDRLARRVDQGTLVCLLSGDRRAELVKESVVRDSRFFVAGEVREVAASGVQSSKLALSLASGIDEDWLLDLFPDDWEDKDEVYWDDRKQQVMRRVSLSCLGLTLDEKIRTDPDPEKAAAILAEQFNRNKIPVPGWDENVDNWIARVQWAGEQFPEEQLPTYGDEDRQRMLQLLCYGETSLRSLKNKDCLAIARQLLNYRQQQFVDAMAPSHIQLPNGRRMKVLYAPGQVPKGRSRIQDFYDMMETPAVAGGKIRILLDILAPNNRTVQITDDLPNFWKVLYPKIRTELARRYPRHLWR